VPPALPLISKGQVLWKLSTGPYIRLGLGAKFYEDWTRVEEVSKKRGISMAQVSLAWTLTRVTAPVVGTTSLEKLEDLISA
jgi:aryl-alcohol dehydrogenase-like predicted oxidoreductase